jgi:hypothetical protein
MSCKEDIATRYCENCAKFFCDDCLHPRKGELKSHVVLNAAEFIGGRRGISPSPTTSSTTSPPSDAAAEVGAAASSSAKRRPGPPTLDHTHYHTQSSVLDLFLYPGTSVAAADSSDSSSTNTTPSTSPLPSPRLGKKSLCRRKSLQAVTADVASLSALAAHTDPGLVTIIADDRPGLCVLDAQTNKWVGPLVLQPEEIVIIGNRSLEQLTKGKVFSCFCSRSCGCIGGHICDHRSHTSPGCGCTYSFAPGG